MALIKPEQLRSGSYNITGSLFGTSSYANFALTASFALNGGGGGSSFPFTGSAIITGSLSVTGSVKSTAGFTGSLQGNATTADFAPNAGNAGHATTATTADQPLDNWIPAKPDPVTRLSPYSLGSPEAWWNSLYVGNSTIYFLSESIGGSIISSSLSVLDDEDGSSRFVLGTKQAGKINKNIIISDKGASLAVTASYALTASFAQNAQTASYFSGSILNAVSASYALTASFAISSSTSISSSFAVSASWAPTQTINTSSLATTGSNQFNGNQSISGSLTVSQSINSYNINVGTPTSNAWQSSFKWFLFLIILHLKQIHLKY